MPIEYSKLKAQMMLRGKAIPRDTYQSNRQKYYTNDHMYGMQTSSHVEYRPEYRVGNGKTTPLILVELQN